MSFYPPTYPSDPSTYPSYPTYPSDQSKYPSYPTDPSNGGLNSGNSHVYYDDEGRLRYAVPQKQPYSMLRWQPTNTAATDTSMVVNNPWRQMPWSERIIPQHSAPPSSSGIVTRRYDDHPSLPGLEYKDYSIAKTNSVKYTAAAAPSDRERLVIDEMKIYDDPPTLWWLFIIDGVLMIVLGILTVIWCLSWDQLYYSRFWVGISLVVFGIVGYLHRGDYLTKWKSVVLITVGIITIAFVMASTALVLQVFCHRLIEVAQFNDWSAYLKEMLFRITWLNDYPAQNLTTLPFPDANLRACFAMDGIMVVLDIVGFLTVTTTAFVIDLFYNSHFVITRRVEPFCQPRLFNPFGQVSLGQAQMFIGFVLQSSVYGNYAIAWQNVFAPVFSGVVPVVAGVFAALSLKSCGINHRCWNFLAIVLEILSIIISVLAIVLVTIGMVQNIQTLQDSAVMTYTTFSRHLMMSSIFIFCASDIVCIVNIFYSVALLIRMLMCICCSKRGDLDVVYQQEGASNDGYSDDESFRQLDKKVVGENERLSDPE